MLYLREAHILAELGKLVKRLRREMTPEDGRRTTIPMYRIPRRKTAEVVAIPRRQLS